jgi:D-glycero-D-manno-heptose 1,7-bisphosphate phosphatase
MLVSMRPTAARRAVFLDRDGVLSELVWNPATGERESPHTLSDLRLCDGAIAALRRLQRSCDLFIVSNQPSYAKGKAGLQTLQAIARAVEEQFRQAGVVFRDAYYCFHHPRGIVPAYTGVCACRKPSPYFLIRAADQYGIDLRRSWMVGDRESDVEAGRGAGCQTILISAPGARSGEAPSRADHVVDGIAAAAAIIVAQSEVMESGGETGARGGGGHGGTAG